MKYSRDNFTLDAVVAGYLGVDIAPGFSPGRTSVPAAEFFRPGTLIDTEGISISLGGVVANTGLALKRFGQRIELMGCVGNDTMGEIVMAKLRAEGLAGGIRRHRRAGTAYGIVIAPPGIDRMFLEDAGCNGVFSAADINYETVARSRLFHFGYPTLMRKMWANHGLELRKMFKRVRSLGVATSLDMALPDPSSDAGQADWRKILTAALPFVDIFVPSIEEILFMMDPQQYGRLLAKAAGGDVVDFVPQEVFARLADDLMAMGAKMLLIKAGHRGAYLRTANVVKLASVTSLKLTPDAVSHRGLWVDSFPVDSHRFKNACGAGDCAVAALLAALLEGMTIEKAARCAMLAGRDNLYGVDSCSGLSDWRQMKRFIESQTQPAGKMGTASFRRKMSKTTMVRKV